MESITAIARPRVGLLGNPSDGYGGRVMAFTFDAFSARVTVTERGGAEPDPIPGAELLSAAAQVLEQHGDAVGAGPMTPSRGGGRRDYVLSFESDIPRQVGMAGSSAIIIAALRALGAWFSVTLDPMTVARLALWAETRILGISAGPQDRVIQAHGGVLAMDFASSRWEVAPVDPGSLPPMVLAWITSPGVNSGVVHDDIRQRFDAGDPEVVQAMATFPRLTADGVACLRGGDVDGFRALMDRNFDQRASIWTLAEDDLAMVRLGREHGAAVKFCGSGGAVVAVPADPSGLAELESAYAAAGFATARPRVCGLDEPGAGS